MLIISALICFVFKRRRNAREKRGNEGNEPQGEDKAGKSELAASESHKMLPRELGGGQVVEADEGVRTQNVYELDAR